MDHEFFTASLLQRSLARNILGQMGGKLNNLILTLWFIFQIQAPAAESCKELYNTNGSDVNKAYPLKLGKKILPVYCHMTTLDGCGGGGWTLVMKMDGSKDTFHYNKLIWTNKLGYNPSAGSTGFDGNETMLPTYWEMKFNRICLGMKIGKRVNFIAINEPASSLFSLIADGKFRKTSLGREKWKMLLPSIASLQSNCNREGFNTFCGGSGALQPRARIGILGNQQNHCYGCDSRIGFGTGGRPDHWSSCGNVASHGWGADNGGKNIKTMGYIFVQ
ncbi:uncharacterized skeletal organic matrix protein 5-like [Pocillopora damicornis]|nr:uncharacterized skeletal organic matrix protein 5-like [Pocillopora damicornis]